MLFGIHGKRKASFNPYLFIFRNKRPWMVALFTNPRHGWSCAGVLINENTIITAAHCLLHTTANEMKAIIGVHTLLGKLNPLNYYSIKSIHRHPKFENCCKNDLAIIKLTKSVLYGPKINSVCLPFQHYLANENDRELTNRTGVIIGWGDSSQNGLENLMKSFTLQQGELKTLNC
jgi:V8-like Glu-specific endopeptidase